jgi:hypothetical protein
MQLGEALRLVRTIEPEAMRHRDHICSEAAMHDVAHCPKTLRQIYAWQVEPDSPIDRGQPERIRSRPRPAGPRSAASTSGYCRCPQQADAMQIPATWDQFWSGNLASGITQRDARKLAKE